MDQESKKRRVLARIQSVKDGLTSLSIDIENDRLFESTPSRIQQRVDKLVTEYAQLIWLRRTIQKGQTNNWTRPEPITIPAVDLSNYKRVSGRVYVDTLVANKQHLELIELEDLGIEVALQRTDTKEIFLIQLNNNCFYVRNNPPPQ